jgi:hypothetical protein
VQIAAVEDDVMRNIVDVRVVETELDEIVKECAVRRTEFDADEPVVVSPRFGHDHRA